MTTMRREDYPSDIHTMPRDGKHECSLNCFCEPEIYYQDEFTGVRAIMHKSEEEMKQ